MAVFDWKGKKIESLLESVPGDACGERSIPESSFKSLGAFGSYINLSK